MTTRYYTSAALPTVLSSASGASGNPSVVSLPGTWPTSFPYTVLLDWGTTAAEAILVTSAPTGTGPYVLPCTRGTDNTTAQAHNAGATAVHGTTGYEPTQIQDNAAAITALAISNLTVPAGDLGGTGASPVVAKIQGTVISPPPTGGGAATEFLRGDGTWDAPPGSGLSLAGDLGNTASVPEVISTHLAAALPVAQGGTASPLGKGLSDWVNAVTGYGADPTGASDSTTAIQNAITAAGAGGTCYLPAGQYKISSTLTITTSGTTLQGTGATTGATAGSLLQWAGGSEAMLKISGCSQAQVRGVTFSDSTASAAYAIQYGANTYYGTLANLVISGISAAGACGIGNNGSDNGIFLHLLEKVSVTGCFNGVSITGATPNAFTFVACEITNNANYGVNVTSGYNWTFTGGDYERNGTASWKLAGCTGTVISGCYLEVLNAGASYSFTATSASPCVFTAAGSGFANGTPVQLTGGSLPAGFSAATTYYAVSASGTAFELAATYGGSAIGSTSAGSGTVAAVTTGLQTGTDTGGRLCDVTVTGGYWNQEAPPGPPYFINAPASTVNRLTCSGVHFGGALSGSSSVADIHNGGGSNQGAYLSCHTSGTIIDTPGNFLTLGGSGTIDTTAADIQPAGTQAAATGASLGIAPDSTHVHAENLGWMAPDQGFKVWNYDPVAVNAGVGSLAPAAGTLYVARLVVRQSVTISKLGIYWLEPASGGADSFVALYSSSGAIQGSSSPDLSATGTGMIFPSIGSQTLTPGIYYAGLMIGTQPGSGAKGGAGFTSSTGSGLFIGNLSAANYRWAITSSTGNSSMPPSFTPSGNGSTTLSFWCALL